MRRPYLRNLLRLAWIIWVLCNEIVKIIFFVSSGHISHCALKSGIASENLWVLNRSECSFHCSAPGLATTKHSSSASLASAAQSRMHNVVPEPFLWAIATCWHLLKVHRWPVFCSSKFWGREVFWLVSPACFVCEADTAGLRRTRPPCISSLL